MDARKRKEVVILLADYMNFLPPGPQEAFVPVGSGGNSEDSGWLITPELELRMDIHSDVGETYRWLDEALVALDFEEPLWYATLWMIYLQDGSGHRDIDDMRIKMGGKQPDHPLALTVARHDLGIAWLADYLSDRELYVRWPQKAPGPQPGQNMDERHSALFAVFLRYKEDGLPYRQAVRNAALKCEYSSRHAERVIKPRWVEYNGEQS